LSKTLNLNDTLAPFERVWKEANIVFQQYLFVFGYPRSGTTMVGSLLGRAPNCLVIPEAQFFIEGLLKFGGIQHAREVLYDYVTKHTRFRLWGFEAPLSWMQGLPTTLTYLEFVKELLFLYGGGRRDYEFIVEHDPQKRYFLETLRAQYPTAPLIHVIRDGRAVAASILKLTWGQQDIIRLAQDWKRSLEIVDEWERKSDCNRVIAVQYENLLDSSSMELEKIFSVLGIENADTTSGALAGDLKVLPYTRAQHVLIGQPLNSSRATAWKDYLTKRQVEIFEFYAGDTLVKLGYDLMCCAPRGPSSVERFIILTGGYFRRRLNKPKQIIRRLRYAKRLS
jgi:hypothetical protein